MQSYMPFPQLRDLVSQIVVREATPVLFTSLSPNLQIVLKSK